MSQGGEAVQQAGREIDAMVDSAQGAPWWVGGLLIALSLVPLLFGWRLAIIGSMLVFAVVAGTVAWEVAIRHVAEGPAAIAVAVAAVVGFVAGYPLYKLGGAVLGALALGCLAALPGLMLEVPIAALVGGAVGALAGLVVGWRYIHHLDAVYTSLTGGYLFAVGAVIVAAHFGAPWLPAIGVGGFVLATVLGIKHQFDVIGPQRVKVDHRARRVRDRQMVAEDAEA